MATDTTNYLLKKPTVGGDDDLWGGYINDNMDTIDTQMKSNDDAAAAAQSTADAALPKAGGTMTGDIAHGDNVKAKFGASDDLQIYHDGSQSIITDTGTGPLRILTPQFRVHNNAMTENMIVADENGAVTLYYDNSNKLATTSTGVDVTGTVTADGVVVQDPTTLGTEIKGLVNAIPSAQTMGYVATGNSTIGVAGDLLIAPRTSAAANIRFVTGTTPTERARIDSSGNVGIGTTSPAAVLELKAAYPALRTTNTGGNYGQLQHEGNNFIFDCSAGDYVFRTGTSFTERARIDSSGNLLIGTTDSRPDDSPTDAGMAIHPNGKTYAFSPSDFGVWNSDATGNKFFWRYNGSTVGTISITTTSTAYNTSSDYRLKKDYQDIATPVDRVKQLNPISFAWKIDDSRVDGFLAHEVQAIVPEAVTGTKDAMRTEEYEVTPAVLDADGNVTTEAVMGTREVPDYQGIDQSKLVPLLTAALQDALAKIETLETKVAALESA